MDSMDFHSLSRRQLQTLCKKNKIAANMTNIAMADALTALTNVIGMEEIGQLDSAMPETPLTSRKTTVRRTATKPQAAEPESTQTLTRPRRTTAKKINKEEESSENTSANETPAPRTARKRVTGTSVCRKLDAQTQEVKEESKEERTVVHAYSTRRSSRLQSDKKISESVHKFGGRRTEAVKIAALNEEDSDDVQTKSSSNAGATQEYLISEDGSSTVVSADVSSNIGEVSSELKDVSNEDSSIISDTQISEISESFISGKDEITLGQDSHADQDMLLEDSKVDTDDLHNMEMKEEVKEEPAVEVTVISPNASPLGKETDVLEKPNVDCLMGSLSSDKVDDMSNEDGMVENNEDGMVENNEDGMLESLEDGLVETHEDGLLESHEDGMVEIHESCEVKKADDSELKFSFEDELCDMQSEVQKSPVKSEMFDFGNMKETMDYISDLERCNQVAAPFDSMVSDVIELGNEKLDGYEMQEYQADDLPVLHLTEATSPPPSAAAPEYAEFKLDDSVSVEQLENKLMDSEKSYSIADAMANALLDDVSTDDEGSVNESDASEESEDEDGSEESDDETVDNDQSDDNEEVHDSPISAFVKSQNPVTPLKTSSAKKTATPNSRMMIRVLEDTEENNESSLKSNSKVLASGVAEEKENNKNEGENTAQKSLKKKSLRQLKKMLSEMTLTDNKKTMGKEELQVEKRSALQMLNDNCLIGKEDNKF